jgi:histidyl-tRNA synthetase
MDTREIKAPAGMSDMLPKDHDYFTYLKKVIRHRGRQAGFRRISTPMLERTDVLKLALAEDADRIEKRMYSLRDPEGTDLTIRSGNTIGIARAYVEKGLKDLPQPISLYYIEQQARFTNVGPGYYRHFHQYGLEVIGQSDAALDAQVIYLAHSIHKDLGIDDRLELNLNSFGNMEIKTNFLHDLTEFFKEKKRSIPAEYERFIEKDPIQLFLTDDEDLQILCQMAPSIESYYDDETREYFQDLCEYLDELGVPYKVNHRMFRKLPYYSGVIFEFWEANRGRKKAVGGGGRYDNLIERLSGTPTPAVNYIAGVERTIAQMKINKVIAPSKDDLHVFVAQLGKEAKKKCLSVLAQMHDSGIKAVGAIGKSSMKEQIAMAESFNAPFMVLMGLTEVREGKAIIREMSKGKQFSIELENLLSEIKKLIGEDNLDKYNPVAGLIKK